MKFSIVVVITCCVVVECRLTQKNTVTMPGDQSSEPAPPMRVIRAADASFSKETDKSYESGQTHKKRSRQAIRYIPPSSPQNQRSHETSTAASATSDANTRQPLVKKPIPKFNEIDYDDDFQSKVIKSAVNIADSGEHEDEDFNVDDYDFDVNHDEFAGRGKPLEPRRKDKPTLLRDNEVDPSTEPPVPKVLQNNIVIPTEPPTPKKPHSSTVIKKIADKINEDYYDEYVTSTKTPSVRGSNVEGNKETKESAPNSVRKKRSLWLVGHVLDQLGQKTSEVMTKFINILPMPPPHKAERRIPQI